MQRCGGKATITPPTENRPRVVRLDERARPSPGMGEKPEKSSELPDDLLMTSMTNSARTSKGDWSAFPLNGINRDENRASSITPAPNKSTIRPPQKTQHNNNNKCPEKRGGDQIGMTIRAPTPVVDGHWGLLLANSPGRPRLRFARGGSLPIDEWLTSPEGFALRSAYSRDKGRKSGEEANGQNVSCVRRHGTLRGASYPPTIT